MFASFELLSKSFSSGQPDYIWYNETTPHVRVATVIGDMSSLSYDLSLRVKSNQTYTCPYTIKI